MPVQKYPYKVTKINWYDYISRGEFNIPFTVSVKSPITAQRFGLDTTVGVYLINKETEDVYIAMGIDVQTVEEDDVYDGTARVSFRIPYYIPVGTYFAVIKYRTKTRIGRIAISTIPTNTKELEVCVLDALGVPLDVDGTQAIPKEKLEMNFDREAADESN